MCVYTPFIDVDMYYIGSDMITGKGLDTHMSVFRPQHRVTRYLLVLMKD